MSGKSVEMLLRLGGGGERGTKLYFAQPQKQDCDVDKSAAIEETSRFSEGKEYRIILTINILYVCASCTPRLAET